MKEVIPYLVILAIALVCIFAIPKNGTPPPEENAVSYADYVNENRTYYFDPVGASSIRSRVTQSRDGYECWWNFNIAEQDFDILSKSIAVQNHGPENGDWQIDSLPPLDWKPDAPTPQWWPLPTTVAVNSKSTFWCFEAGPGERHKGWFLAFDRTNSVASIWRWNHQWSANECESTMPAKQQFDE